MAFASTRVLIYFFLIWLANPSPIYPAANQVKQAHLGPNYAKFPAFNCNDPHHTNISPVRMAFRYETYMERLFSLARTVELADNEKFTIPGYPHISISLSSASEAPSNMLAIAAAEAIAKGAAAANDAGGGGDGTSDKKLTKEDDDSLGGFNPHTKFAQSINKHVPQVAGHKSKSKDVEEQITEEAKSLEKHESAIAALAEDDEEIEAYPPRRPNEDSDKPKEAKIQSVSSLKWLLMKKRVQDQKAELAKTQNKDLKYSRIHVTSDADMHPMLRQDLAEGFAVQEEEIVAHMVVGSTNGASATNGNDTNDDTAKKQLEIQRVARKKKQNAAMETLQEMEENKLIANSLRKALILREKYVFKQHLLPKHAEYWRGGSAKAAETAKTAASFLIGDRKIASKEEEEIPKMSGKNSSVSNAFGAAVMAKKTNSDISSLKNLAKHGVGGAMKNSVDKNDGSLDEDEQQFHPDRPTLAAMENSGDAGSEAGNSKDSSDAIAAFVERSSGPKLLYPWPEHFPGLKAASHGLSVAPSPRRDAANQDAEGKKYAADSQSSKTSGAHVFTANTLESSDAQGVHTTPDEEISKHEKIWTTAQFKFGGFSNTKGKEHYQPPGIVGVMIKTPDGKKSSLSSMPTFKEFVEDLNMLMKITTSEEVASFCWNRLELLERKWDMHNFLNGELEQASAEMSKSDFYSIPKVDLNLWMGSSMTSRELLSFLKEKLKDNADDLIGDDFKGNSTKNAAQVQPQHARTLKDAFAAATVYSAADMQADSLGSSHSSEGTVQTNLKRTDAFWADERNIFGSSELRALFLQHPANENNIHDPHAHNVEEGKYFAELIREKVFKRDQVKSFKKSVLNALRSQKSSPGDALATAVEKKQTAARSQEHKAGKTNHVYTESRITLHGMSKNEWGNLSHWMAKHNLLGYDNMFVICYPRAFHIHRKLGVISNFHEWLENVFSPLFEATLRPEQHPVLAKFLENVAGFDTDDDETTAGLAGIAYLRKMEENPKKFTGKISGGQHRSNDDDDQNIGEAAQSQYENPHFCYYVYYLACNITVLNKLREARGMNTFSFRPHCGENLKASALHLISGFLLSHGIAHGVQLKQFPSLAYLFFLSQVGVAMSPLSNNASGVIPLRKSPVFDFFRWGLNLSLATDSPLRFHTTNCPLLEEYTTNQHYWSMSLTDVCELAQNSVLQSNLPLWKKQELLGKNCFFKSYKYPWKFWNWWNRSNVSDIRISFRKRCYARETEMLEYYHHADFSEYWHAAGLASRKEASQASAVAAGSSQGGKSPRNFVEKAAGMMGFGLLKRGADASLEECVAALDQLKRFKSNFKNGNVATKLKKSMPGKKKTSDAGGGGGGCSVM